MLGLGISMQTLTMSLPLHSSREGLCSTCGAVTEVSTVLCNASALLDTGWVSSPGASTGGCAAAHGARAALEGDHKGQQLVGRQQAGWRAQAAAR